jgi:RNA polymerase sigma factor (sigma-70 family)
MQNDFITDLYRAEYSKIVTLLCKSYGISHMELAEDVVSDTFLKATETWGLKGIPKNPGAWLYTVAKNRMKDHFRRNGIFNEKIAPTLSQQADESDATYDTFSEESINDNMLRMMFVVCDPAIALESQIALALRILCGFTIDEICNALVANKESINKRLYRGRESLKKGLQLRDITNKAIQERLDGVLTILYLMFNEGYFSTTSKEKIRRDMCYESMRLLHLLTRFQQTNKPRVNALMALFCFQVSRFDARLSPNEDQILYDAQNTDQWNMDLIRKGEYYMTLSVSDMPHTRYHLESLIAFWHTRKKAEPTTKWNSILQLYNRLLQLQYSPVAALNRTYALARVHGNRIALKEALKIKLNDNPLYHVLLAELYTDIDEKKRLECLRTAITKTKNESDKKLLTLKLQKSKC